MFHLSGQGIYSYVYLGNGKSFVVSGCAKPGLRSGPNHFGMTMRSGLLASTHGSILLMPRLDSPSPPPATMISISNFVGRSSYM